jgi:hypothetical protein
VGLHAVIGVAALVAVIALLLVAFYKPFPTITIINAADQPLQDLRLKTFGSESQGETHELGTLEVGQSEEVTVRSYEVTVLGLTFEIDGEPVQHENDPLPLTQGQAMRFTVEPGGKVTGVFLY